MFLVHRVKSSPATPESKSHLNGLAAPISRSGITVAPILAIPGDPGDIP
jgi:hypothetical protein